MIYIVHIESVNHINLLYIYNIPERGGNDSQQSLQEQRLFFVSRVHDKFGRLLDCPATDVLVVLVVGVGGGHVVAIAPL